ncbi:MAG: hypothetical protein II820_05490 [Ruminiclostridium sp.]|nr:hypothetical protein [Ruminiclostridium sp.]
MRIKRIISISAAVLATAVTASCSGQANNASSATTTAQTTTAATTEQATTTTQAATTTETTTEEITEPEEEDDISDEFGVGLDILASTVYEFDEPVTDEAAFGNKEIIDKLKSKCFTDYSEHISHFNEESEKPINSPDDISFVSGVIYDFNKDGTDDLSVNLMYTPSDYLIPGCALYYVDGKSGTASEMISGGVNADGVTNYGAVNSGSDIDRILSVWDYGDFVIAAEVSGMTPLSTHLNLFRINADSSYELVTHWSDIRNDGKLLYVLDSISIGYQYTPAVFTADGEFKRLGFEEISVDKFSALLEYDSKLNEWFTNTADSYFGSSDTDILDKVYTCGYSMFMIWCKPEIRENEWERYIFCSPLPTDYPPVIIDTDYHDDYLYGINVGKLNIINQ